jgi:hypothetical protein
VRSLSSLRTDKRACRVPNSVSSPEALTCGDASFPAPCHLAFVPYSCHFFSADWRRLSNSVRPFAHRRGPFPSSGMGLPPGFGRSSAVEQCGEESGEPDSGCLGVTVQ